MRVFGEKIPVEVMLKSTYSSFVSKNIAGIRFKEIDGLSEKVKQSGRAVGHYFLLSNRIFASAQPVITFNEFLMTRLIEDYRRAHRPDPANFRVYEEEQRAFCSNVFDHIMTYFRAFDKGNLVE
jgi:hypothetical protein